MLNRPTYTLKQIKDYSYWLAEHMEEALNMTWISDSGKERWKAILNIPLPPLELMDLKITHQEWTGRVCWLACYKNDAAILQERKHREELTKRYLIPMDLSNISLEDKTIILGAWLNWQAEGFFNLSENQRKKYIDNLPPEITFQGCIMGVMAQRKDATTLIKPEDFS